MKKLFVIDPGDPEMCLRCDFLADDFCLLFNKPLELDDGWEDRLEECKANEVEFGKDARVGVLIDSDAVPERWRRFGLDYQQCDAGPSEVRR